MDSRTGRKRKRWIRPDDGQRREYAHACVEAAQVSTAAGAAARAPHGRAVAADEFKHVALVSARGCSSQPAAVACDLAAAADITRGVS